nr:MAG TPA: hypothetical protein [Caudoviricetes sp.]
MVAAEPLQTERSTLFCEGNCKAVAYKTADAKKAVPIIIGTEIEHRKKGKRQKIYEREI